MRARVTKEVRLDCVRRNVARIRGVVGPGVRVMAVVKADLLGALGLERLDAQVREAHTCPGELHAPKRVRSAEDIAQDGAHARVDFEYADAQYCPGAFAPIGAPG